MVSINNTSVINISVQKTSWDSLIGFSGSIPTQSGTFSSAWRKYFTNLFIINAKEKIAYSRKESAMISIFIVPLIINIIKDMLITVLGTILITIVVIIVLFFYIICFPCLLLTDHIKTVFAFVATPTTIPLWIFFSTLAVVCNIVFIPIFFLIALYSLIFDRWCCGEENVDVVVSTV